MFTGAISVFGSSKESGNSNTVAPNNAEIVPDDIPKEELVQLCMKLNKRMQQLESSNAELSKAIKRLKNEGQRYYELFSEILAVPLLVNDDDAISIDNLRLIWLKIDSERKIKLKEMEEKINILSGGKGELGIDTTTQEKPALSVRDTKFIEVLQYSFIIYYK